MASMDRMKIKALFEEFPGLHKYTQEGITEKIRVSRIIEEFLKFSPPADHYGCHEGQFLLLDENWKLLLCVGLKRVFGILWRYEFLETVETALLRLPKGAEVKYGLIIDEGGRRATIYKPPKDFSLTREFGLARLKEVRAREVQSQIAV